MRFSTYHTRLNATTDFNGQTKQVKQGPRRFLYIRSPPSHTAHQQACVSDNISDKCSLSSQKYETPLETKQAFPQSASLG